MLIGVRRALLRLRLSLVASTRDYLAVADASRTLIAAHGAGALAEARRRGRQASGRQRLFWRYVEAELELRGARDADSRPGAPLGAPSSDQSPGR